jgi:hypothetical protein
MPQRLLGRWRAAATSCALARAQRRPKNFYLPTAISARVRATHQLQGCFHVSPGFGLLRLALLFAGASLLSGLDNCLLPMGLKQLSRIILDFDFSHPHGASSSHSEKA